MSDVVQFWVYLSSTPLLGLTMTLVAYILANVFYDWRGRAPWANPLVGATVLVILLLTISHTAYPTYFSGAQFIHFLLGPSVVALALPLWQRLPELRRNALPLIGASIIGGGIAGGSALLLGWSMGLPHDVAVSLLPKSITSPVAMGVAEKIGGVPTLTAVFTVLTGVLGAALGKYLFQFVHIRSWQALGFALGTCCHGLGTARSIQVNPDAGAYAALALGMQAVLGALLIPLIFHLFA